MKKINKELFMYLVFGCLTTLINIVCYYVLYNILNSSNIVSVTVAWALSVMFAFITNKIYVFKSKSFAWSIILREACLFLLYRIFSGILDLAIMYVSVDIIRLDSTICKLTSNIIVIIINYVLSKFHVFEDKQ